MYSLGSIKVKASEKMNYHN